MCLGLGLFGLSPNCYCWNPARFPQNRFPSCVSRSAKNRPTARPRHARGDHLKPVGHFSRMLAASPLGGGGQTPETGIEREKHEQKQHVNSTVRQARALITMPPVRPNSQKRLKRYHIVNTILPKVKEETRQLWPCGRPAPSPGGGLATISSPRRHKRVKTHTK